MISLQPMQLSELIRMLDAGEQFSFTRYWDGEMASIVGRTGKNVDSCEYTDELRLALRQTLINNKSYFHAIFFPTWHKGTVNLRRQFEEYLNITQCQVKWCDAMMFQRAFETGSLYPFIRSLKKRNCIMVGPKRLRPMTDILNLKYFIEIPEADAFNGRLRIENDVREASLKYSEPVYLFSAGMASNVIIDDMYDGLDGTMIDMGSVWDAALKLRTRIWMRSLPDCVIRRNLNG